MPYEKISDLPEKQVDQYSKHQKEAFFKAYNKPYEAAKNADDDSDS